MAEKDFKPDARRLWMLLMVPFVLLALAGMAIFLLPPHSDPSRAPQKTGSAQISGTTEYTVRTPPPPPTCTASVKVDKVLSNGFQATVTVKNTSDQTLNSWMVYWGLASGVTFVKGWNANVFQDGDVIMAHPESTAHSFPAGGTMSFGFEATGPSNQPVTVVALNGIPCTV